MDGDGPSLPRVVGTVSISFKLRYPGKHAPRVASTTNNPRLEEGLHDAKIALYTWSVRVMEGGM